MEAVKNERKKNPKKESRESVCVQRAQLFTSYIQTLVSPIAFWLDSCPSVWWRAPVAFMLLNLPLLCVSLANVPISSNFALFDAHDRVLYLNTSVYFAKFCNQHDSSGDVGSQKSIRSAFQSNIIIISIREKRRQRESSIAKRESRESSMMHAINNGQQTSHLTFMSESCCFS